MVWLDAVGYDSVWRASTCSGRVTALPSETPQKAGLVGHGNDSGWKVKLTSNAEVSFSGSSVTTPASNGELSSECSMPEEGVVGQDVSIGSSSMGSVPESGSWDGRDSAFAEFSGTCVSELSISFGDSVLAKFSSVSTLSA
ncbi:unnamed protein product [Caenorhabditis bovis]|uniref:Uncharacterized protein n=1 Tax=Caenorhabditis bovis TaxID=2654633 RepID=A0A8S1E7T1_9PELO|nr:unnamed protein product [Caenorhabditis bovis]